MPYTFNPLSGAFDYYTKLVNPLLFKGTIAVAADFPTLAEVQTGWFYAVSATVTDNNPAKTNTGQSFISGDEIVWNGTNWSLLGNLTSALLLDQTTPQTVINGIPTFAAGEMVGTATTGATTYSFSAWPTTAARNNYTSSVGFEFVPTADITINKFGRLYVVGNSQNHTVNLWDVSGQKLLATGTILAASASDGNNFKWVSITPITLVKGMPYRVACNETSGGDTWKDSWTPSMSADFTYLQGAYIGSQDTYPGLVSGSGNMYDTVAFEYTKDTVTGAMALRSIKPFSATSPSVDITNSSGTAFASFNALSNTLKITNTALTTTVSDGFALVNDTLSTGSVTSQYSPALRFRSHVWDTDGSDDIYDYYIYGAGGSGPTTLSYLIFGYKKNNAAITQTMYLAGSYVYSAGGFQANSGSMLATRPDIRTTSTDGLIASNSTAATAGIPVQYSPRLKFTGTAWDTAGAGSSKTINWKNEVVPTSGNPTTSLLRWSADQGVASYTDILNLSNNGNLGLGQSSFGTSATKTIAIGTGIAPSDSPADAFQMYSADFAAGNACPYFRTENGTTIGLNQSLLTTSTVQFSQIQIDNSSTYLDKDGSGNMTFTDAVTGTKTLAELAAGGGGTLAQTLAIGNVTGGYDIAFDTNGDVITDGTNTSIDPYNRILYAPNGSTPMLGWGDATDYNLYFGYGATVGGGNNQIAIGGNANASSTGGNATVALGQNTVASGGGAIAAGYACSATGGNASSFGDWCIASGDFSLAQGSSATASANYSAIIGGFNSGYTNSIANSMVLGGYSGSADEAWLRLGTGGIYDLQATPYLSISPSSRTLNDEYGNSVLSWASGGYYEVAIGNLHFTGSSSNAYISAYANGGVDVYNEILISHSGGGGVNSLDWINRKLYNSSGTEIWDWTTYSGFSYTPSSTGGLYAGSSLRFDLYGNMLYDDAGTPAACINLNTTRQLIASDGTSPTFTWASASAPKLNGLTTDGFVKTSSSDGTLTIDTNTYSRWRGVSSGNPSSPLEGDLYYDSSDSKVYIYANSGWVALT